MLLDMAGERDIRLTFFVLGSCVVRSQHILRRQVAENHEIGNHTWSHSRLVRGSVEEMRHELERTDAAVIGAGGQRTHLMRPPYGELTQPQRETAELLGYRVVLWNVDSMDWQRRDSAKLVSEIIRKVFPGCIVLAHDIHRSTIDAMPTVFDTLLARGFKFATVGELLRARRSRPLADVGPPL